MAEELKIKFGHALPDSVPPDEEVQIPGFQGQPRRLVRRRSMCQPIHERLTETLKLVLVQVKQAGLRQLPPGGIVITGGSAEIAGLEELVKRSTGAPVRIGYPRGILGLPAQLKKPAFSTSVGSLLWGIKHQGEGRQARSSSRSLPGYRSLVRRFTRKPEGVPV
jgi:cell division protein FtsA